MKLGNYVNNTESYPEPDDGITPADLEPGQVNANPDDPSANPEVDNEIQVANTGERINQVQEEQEAREEDLHASSQDSIKLENAAQTLDEIQEQANNMVVEDGVLSPTAATLITQTLESIHKMVGFTQPVVPVMEAFKGTWTKKSASQATLEAIDDSQKSIVDRIISGLKAALSTAMRFLANLFQNRMMMEAYITKLIARANALNEKDATTTSKTVSGRFSHGLQFGPDSNFATTCRILYTAQASVGFFAECNQIVQDLRDMRPTAGRTNAVGKFYRSIGETDVTIGGNTFSAAGAFPNGFSIVDSDKVDELQFNTNLSDNTPISSESTTLSLSEVETILGLALTAIRDLRKAESTSARITDAVKGIIRRIEQQYNSLRGAMGSEQHATKARVQKHSFTVQRMLTRLVSRIPSMIFTSVKYAGDYAKASMDQYH